MINSLRSGLCCIISEIDKGNSELSKDDEESIVRLVRKVVRTDQAYNYLNVSRATFDRLVKEGKIVSGRKLAGFKEKVWYKRDLLLINNTRNGVKD